MYIELFGSSDRLGGNIVDMISQILYAVNNKIYIKYDRNNLFVYGSYNQQYNKTVFMETLFDYIDIYNKNVDYSQEEKIDLTAPSHYEGFSKTLLDIKEDMFSYFKNNINMVEFRKIFNKRCHSHGYKIDFDPKKTILVHLRLEDVKHRNDYDGSICSDIFRNHIEKGLIPDNDFDSELLKKHPNNNAQAPLSFGKIQECIDTILKDYPDNEVIIVTSPNENLSHLPYKCISSNDECYDLFLLCNSEKLILSRSNFALTSLFFGISKETYVPLWKVIVCLGLYTKYDKSKFKYFK